MRKAFALSVALIMLATLVAACGPTPEPQIVRETVVVTEQVEVEKTVVVTQEVEKEVMVTKEVPVEVVATPTPRPPMPLVGKIEGPEVITDPAQFPKEFNEAPMLAELVEAGQLPPVEERLPEEPLVIKPLHEIGKYGGTWHRGFVGPADWECAGRLSATDKLIFTDYTGVETVPSAAKSMEIGDGGRTFTISLRKGMKWSDGQPFTADDIMFWYEDMYQNTDLMPAPTGELSVNFKPGTLEKVDDYTVRFVFPEPYYLFETILKSDTMVGGGQTRHGMNLMGGYAPAHYLQQFHPEYVSQEELDNKVKEAGVDNWVVLFKSKANWALNPDLPVLAPWRTVVPIDTPTWVLERNPYYWEVDTEGNQLPYIDKVLITLGEDVEVINLRAIAGEYDFQSRHLQFPKLPVLLENQERGGYKVYLDVPNFGCDTGVAFNQSYDADPEIAKWLTNRDFRRALSLGLDRDQFNEVFYLGLGTPGSVVVADDHPHNPGPEYRTAWSTYDPEGANEMLDEIGLDEKDAEGYRLRTDGQGRLRIQLNHYVGIYDYRGDCDMIRDQWREIGIQADCLELERSLYYGGSQDNSFQASIVSSIGTEGMWTFPIQVFPCTQMWGAVTGPEFAKWYDSGGTQGREPTDPKLARACDLFYAARGVPYEEQVKMGQEMWRLVVEEQWTIGIVGQSPQFLGIRVVKNNMGNIPERQCTNLDCRVPSASHPATFFFKD